MPKVEGREALELDRAEVWRLLNEPDTLAASIPGCRGFERDGDAEHRYRTSISVAVGPVTGVYEGTVEYTDVEEPERCTIVVSGKGDKGTIDGGGEIRLAEREGATEIAYVGDFKLTGPVAGVGQRMAPGVTRKMIVETLHNLESRGGRPPGPTTDADPGASPQPDPVTTTPGAAPPPPAATEPFRPVTVSPALALAFAAGCLVGFGLGALRR